MLTTRAGKRDKTSAFGDLIFDILDEGRPIGSVVFDKKELAAAITVDGKAYRVARAREQHNEMLHQALIRVMTGADKPPPNPWALKDAAGRTLALGERVGEVSRPYHLYRHGSEQSLGSVGQAKFFTRTLHMNLPAEFDAAFQVFLLTLLLSLTFENLESLTRY